MKIKEILPRRALGPHDAAAGPPTAQGRRPGHGVVPAVDLDGPFRQVGAVFGGEILGVDEQRAGHGASERTGGDGGGEVVEEEGGSQEEEEGGIHFRKIFLAGCR